ncbi:MAG: phosphopyruvate hydratase [Patescibacteria group bacterium]|nr:phosphopyruvate hydratase [Patescibacteria group bacterium]
MEINKIMAEGIKDSRNNPTIKVSVFVGDMSDSFSVPSGASTGIHEAHELEIDRAIKNVNEIIAPVLIGRDVSKQKEIDQAMLDLDGTYNKDNLGGNAMIGVSIACAKTAAKVLNKEVYEHLRTLIDIEVSNKNPHLFINLINGGKHAKNDLAFQEYHIVPTTKNIEEAVKIGNLVQDKLEEKLGKVEIGDEGGFAPKVKDIREPLVLLTEIIKENNLKVKLSMDVAASSFYENGKYLVDGQKIDKYELMEKYNSLIDEFNIFSIEDPFEEEDFNGFEKLKETGIDVIGDDLTVTNKDLLKKGLGSITGMIVKPNQIGTLTETLETMKLAKENDIKLIVSHRSGETDDNFIADLAYAFSCFGLKAGSPRKKERMVKYQRLIDIV